MRAVVQRVRTASVAVADEVVGRIDLGLLVYVGAMRGDGDTDLDYVAQKVVGLRIFEDDVGKMSRGVLDVGGSILLIPQFTLFGDVRRGRRPSFDDAELPERAAELFERLRAKVEALGPSVRTGRFRAEMLVSGEVLGPVTILLDSRKLF
ncbi:MAG: D-aminoacyl-tRNA deacylase [Sandaracinaceae bacterium]